MTTAKSNNGPLNKVWKQPSTFFQEKNMNKNMQDLNKRVDSGPNVYPDSTAISTKSYTKKSKMIDTRMKLNNYLK
jgi:hypothetical protein